jgi:hypothetical protein
VGGLEPGYSATAYAGIVTTAAQKAVVSKAGHANIVLAKNDGNVLPINKAAIKSVALVGPKSCLGPRFGAIGSGLTTGTTIGPLDAIKQKLGTGVSVISDGTWQTADYVVVFVGINDSGEGFDRQNLDLPKYNATGDLAKNNFNDTTETGFDQDQNALVAQVLAAKPTKTVVVYTGGSFSVAGTWSTAPGVIIALYPGGDQGNAIADVLFGDYNPGGHLSITFPQKAEDVPPWGVVAATFSTYEPVEEGRGWSYYDKKNLHDVRVQQHPDHPRHDARHRFGHRERGRAQQRRARGRRGRAAVRRGRRGERAEAREGSARLPARHAPARREEDDHVQADTRRPRVLQRHRVQVRGRARRVQRAGRIVIARHQADRIVLARAVGGHVVNVSDTEAPGATRWSRHGCVRQQAFVRLAVNPTMAGSFYEYGIGFANYSLGLRPFGAPQTARIVTTAFSRSIS